MIGDVVDVASVVIGSIVSVSSSEISVFFLLVSSSSAVASSDGWSWSCSEAATVAILDSLKAPHGTSDSSLQAPDSTTRTSPS